MWPPWTAGPDLLLRWLPLDLYGPQFNVARDNWTCALANYIEAPPWAKYFDDTIYPLDKKSTYCLPTASLRRRTTAWRRKGAALLLRGSGGSHPAPLRARPHALPPTLAKR